MNITKYITLTAFMAYPLMAGFNPKVMKLNASATRVAQGTCIDFTPEWADGTPVEVTANVRIKRGTEIIINGTASAIETTGFFGSTTIIVDPFHWNTKRPNSTGAQTGAYVEPGSYYCGAKSENNSWYVSGPTITILKAKVFGIHVRLDGNQSYENLNGHAWTSIRELDGQNGSSYGSYPLDMTKWCHPRYSELVYYDPENPPRFPALTLLPDPLNEEKSYILPLAHITPVHNSSNDIENGTCSLLVGPPTSGYFANYAIPLGETEVFLIEYPVEHLADPMDGAINRYYILSIEQNESFQQVLAAEHSWGKTHNCSSFARDAVSAVVGENVSADDPWLWWTETPTKFASSINDLEADTPSSPSAPYKYPPCESCTGN